MRKLRTAVLLLVAAALAGYAGTRWYKLSHYPRWFATVAIGDTKETVIQKMGKPDNANRPPHWCHSPECDSEFMYGHSIPPEWWVVGFNRHGRAVWVAELQSP